MKARIRGRYVMKKGMRVAEGDWGDVACTCSRLDHPCSISFIHRDRQSIIWFIGKREDAGRGNRGEEQTNEHQAEWPECREK